MILILAYFNMQALISSIFSTLPLIHNPSLLVPLSPDLFHSRSKRCYWLLAYSIFKSGKWVTKPTGSTCNQFPFTSMP